MIGRETTESFGKILSAMAEGSGALLWKGVAVMFTVETASPEETAALAERIGGLCPAETVFALAGDLGAGKTLFVQGLARGLGFSGEVTSPTFNLMNVYEGKMRLTHFDVYRLERAEELYDIGFYEYSAEEAGSEEAANRRRLCFSLVGVQLKEFFEEMRDVVDSGD